MSACWPSEPHRSNRRMPGAVHAVAWLAALLALVPGASLVHAKSRPAARDSSSTVSSVRVDDRGVFIDRQATAADSTGDWGDDWNTSRRRWRERLRTHIHTGNGSIRVDDSGQGIVRIWSDAHVPAGDTIDGDVVAVFGSVDVEGAVTGDVVSVLGSVHLRDGARVDGSAVSVGGRLEQAPGVTVKGETVQVGLAPITFGLPARSVILFAVAAGWLVSMFTGWIFALMFPTAMLRVGTVVERRPAASFFLGLLSVPMALMALVLLCITVIGLPLAVLLPMVFMLMGYLGQLAATAVLGARLTRRSLAHGMMTPLFVGTVFVALLLAIGGFMLVGARDLSQPVALFFLLSGCLLLLGLGALGTGAFLLSRFGTRPPDVVWHGGAPLPAGVAPVAAPPAAG